MVLVLLLASAQLACLALVPSLQAAIVRTPAVVLRTIDAPSLSGRSRARTLELPIRADMLGATWTGSRHGLQLRARGNDGRWSAWVDIDDAGDGPDPRSPESRATRGRHVLASPLWVGDADHVQLRTSSASTSVHAVELTVLNVTGTATAPGRLATRARATAAKVLGAAAPGDAAAVPLAPGIHLRASWGAMQPRALPAYAPEVRGVVIHHTASTNNYSCGQVPALLRGFQRYHQKSLGWNDIGYNYLVDKCGGVWEGRGGGLVRPVIGAHTSGFNTGTVGISLIGAFTKVRPTAKALAAVDRLVAWRLDVAHVKPAGTMQLVARSSDKFRLGTTVTMRAVSGHRDLFPTSCPGALTYAQLSGIALRATRSGGLKVQNVTPTPTIDPTTGEVGALAVRWLTNSKVASSVLSVERISDGRVIATRSVTGLFPSVSLADADLRVDGVLPRIWDLRLRVSATTPTLRARFALIDLGAAYGTAPGFTVTTPPADTVAPASAPPGNQLHVGFTLTRSAVLGAWLRDPTTGERIATLHEPRWRTAAPAQEFLDLGVPDDVPAGSYVLEVGVEADTAPGRSIARFPVTVVR